MNFSHTLTCSLCRAVRVLSDAKHCGLTTLARPTTIVDIGIEGERNYKFRSARSMNFSHTLTY